MVPRWGAHHSQSNNAERGTYLVKEYSWETIAEQRGEGLPQLRDADKLSGFPITRRDWSDDLTALLEKASPGTSTLEYDKLVSGSKQVSEEAALGLAEMTAGAKHEFLVLNAYIIPGERAMEIFRTLGERGVRVRVLTNSLASNDVPAVTAKYKKYRKPLIEAGVELYEFSTHPEIQAGIVDTDPVDARFAGLHTKALVVDREHVYIGSLNLDPRSILLNTEMGMIVTSPGFAAQVAAIAERDMSPTNSWRVRLDVNGDLVWESAEGTVSRQPAQSGWQRVQAWFFKIVPESQL